MAFDAFRSQILSNAGEQAVEVNQRVLIDKILARYSSEFVIYRELMQNSDDAESSSIQIKFETESDKKFRDKIMRNLFNKHSKEMKEEKDEKTNKEMKEEKLGKIVRILFKNDGFDFRHQDWARLKMIAEGNPDEDKIGAFGIGFYSLFSVCENPFVSSGGQGMAFYWRGNQLFTKKGPTGEKDKGWTTFLMDLREPMELPNVEEFARFLANSLAFTGNLRDVSVYLNDTLIIHLSKQVQKPNSMEIAPEFDTFSPQKMFHLTSADIRGVQLDVRRLLFPENISAKQLCSTKHSMEESSIFLRIASGNLNVKVSDEFSAEMERITKKKPQSKTSIQMIFTEFDELISSEDYCKNTSPVFKDLLPYPEQGRIYIGFPTQQTTGCCSHLTARVIPTMERESIDLATKTLAEYNNEILCLVGTLCRILYENEMAQITRIYNEMIGDNAKDKKFEKTKTFHDLSEYTFTRFKPNKPKYNKKLNSFCKWLKRRALYTLSHYTTKIPPNIIVEPEDEKTMTFREWLERRAAHALTHFTFNQSTPNAQVSKIAELQFFNCSEQKLCIMSTEGVHPISNVRLPNSEMEGFIKTIPVVPKFILEQCETFLTKAKDTKLIEDMTFKDVLSELKNRVLPEEETVELLKWWISYVTKGNNVDSMQLSLMQIHDQAPIEVRYFLNPGIIPPDVDLPGGVLPYPISQKLKKEGIKDLDLVKCCGWSELSLVNWAKFIVNKPDLEVDPTFAEKVHQILSRSLNKTSQPDKEIIRKLFVKKKCIPTKLGMKFPHESYMENVNLFPDLPTIKLQKSSSVNNVMELLGVRKVIELKIIFDRLMNHDDWNHMELVKYLASVSTSLKEKDMDILKKEPIWPRENLDDLNFDSNKKIKRFVASELYTPIKFHRELGLPVIDWNNKWFNNNSPEGKFLIQIGLRTYPALGKIIRLSAPPTDPKIRSKAFEYFVDNFKLKYILIYNAAEVETSFLPCTDSNVYAKPSECYTNPRCMIMNFKVIRQDLQDQAEKFGVHENPSSTELIKRLTENPPQDEDKAKEVFEYLASLEGDWNSNLLADLKFIKFIPIRDKIRPGKFIYISPSDCFFNQEIKKFLRDFYLCIDFGEKANKFLENCGVKKEPPIADFVDLLVKNQDNWDHIELAKYLASMGLSTDEIDLLKSKPIWPRENFEERFVASYLYAPSKRHREFGLPVIEWRIGCFSNNSNMNTPERKFLVHLGLQTHPTLEKIIELSAPTTDPEIRSKAFEYFIDNFKDKYSVIYNAAEVDIPFIPCSDSNLYAKPLGCYINPGCKSMKYHVVRQDIRDKIKKFGVSENPSYTELSNKLIKDPPQDEVKAKEVFEFLASLGGNDWKTSLADRKFIPIRQPDEIIFVDPSSCVLKKGTRKPFRNFFSCFNFIDFGEKANKFLERCGVKRELEPTDLAELLVKSSRELWDSAGDDTEGYYLSILQKIAYGSKSLSSSLIAKMRKEPILVGIDNKDGLYCLASASEIFISDDMIYQRIFNPLAVPREALEAFYKVLGCKSLHESVKETLNPVGTIQKTKYSQQLQKMIMERAFLFYFKHPENYSDVREIRNDEKWVKKLKIREAEYLETSYILGTTTKNEKSKITTSILNDKSIIGSWTLYVTSNSNLLDIAQLLVKNIYKSYNWKDVSYLNMLLTAPVSSLKDMGYPVDSLTKQGILPKLQNIFSNSDANDIFQSVIDDMDSESFANEESEKPIIVTSENTQILQRFLRDAIKACYSNSGIIVNRQASIDYAIKACRSNLKNNVNGQVNIKILNESRISYCNIIPGYLLCSVGTSQEIELYVPKDSNQSEILSQSRADSLNRFINIMKDLADIFQITPKAIRIFYDDNVNSIAFNRDGALFFNLKFYIGLHDEECKIKPTMDTMTYWFMTFCHELAHNFIESHDSEHEYYFSSFAKIYMPSFLSMMKKREILPKSLNIKTFLQNFVHNFGR